MGLNDPSQKKVMEKFITLLANDVELFPILAAAGCRREEQKIILENRGSNLEPAETKGIGRRFTTML